MLRFDLHEIELVGGTYFIMMVSNRLVLSQRQKATGKWPFQLFVSKRD